MSFYGLFNAMIGQAGPAAGGNWWDLLLIGALVFMVFYFIVILPEQKKQNSRKTMLDAMKHDDEVVTTGGIYGKVTAIADQVVTLEISQGVRIKVLRTAIAGIRGKETKDGKEAKDKDK